MSVSDPVLVRRRLVPLSDPAVRELTGETAISTLYQLARDVPPRLPGVVRVGRRVLIDLKKLESWIEAGGESAGTL
jgi:hypothetical protein